jgi:acetyl/propionyl-CoA carboxylase alpha subunit
MGDRILSIVSGDRTGQVTIREDGAILVGDLTLRVALATMPGEVVVSNGTAIERLFLVTVGETTWVFHNGDTFELMVEAESRTPSTGARRGHHEALMAPMPATVVSIDTRPGETVRRGAILMVLEAMKMELPVRAPSDGTVAAVHCRPGDLVQPGVPLIELQ